MPSRSSRRVHRRSRSARQRLRRRRTPQSGTRSNLRSPGPPTHGLTTGRCHRRGMKLGASRAAAITVLVREHHGDGICDDEPRRDGVRARFLDHVLRKRSNDPQGGAASLRRPPLARRRLVVDRPSLRRAFARCGLIASRGRCSEKGTAIERARGTQEDAAVLARRGPTSVLAAFAGAGAGRNGNARLPPRQSARLRRVLG